MSNKEIIYLIKKYFYYYDSSYHTTILKKIKRIYSHIYSHIYSDSYLLKKDDYLIYSFYYLYVYKTCGKKKHLHNKKYLDKMSKLDRCSKYFVLGAKCKNTICYHILGLLSIHRIKYNFNNMSLDDIFNNTIVSKNMHEFASNNGYHPSQYQLARIYDNLFKDFIQAEKYYILAIKCGNINYIYNFALFYDKNKDYINAEKYYKMAIEKGCIRSMIKLGIMYFNNPESDEYKLCLAEEYFRIGIKYGNILAYRCMGKCYIEYKKDIDNGMKYIKICINKGDKESRKYMIKYYQQIKDYKSMTYYKNKYKIFSEEFNRMYNKYDIKENDDDCNEDCIICMKRKADMYCKSCKNASSCLYCGFEWLLLNINNNCPLCRN